MGWAVKSLYNRDGLEAETGLHKLWAAMANEQDAGVDGAINHVEDVFDWLNARHLLDSVSAIKVSTDGQCILVVYLAVGVDFHAPAAHDIADIIRQYCGAPTAKVGWAHEVGSEVLATL